MDRTSRCPKCGKRMVPVVTFSGRTDLQCISCDDPAVKWAESPLTAPESNRTRTRLNYFARPGGQAYVLKLSEVNPNRLLEGTAPKMALCRGDDLIGIGTR